MNIKSKFFTGLASFLGLSISASTAFAAKSLLQDLENKIMTPMVFIMNSLSGNMGKLIIGLTVCAGMVMVIFFSRKRFFGVVLLVAAFAMGIVFKNPMKAAEWAMQEAMTPVLEERVTEPEQPEQEIAEGEISEAQLKYQKDYQAWKEKYEAWEKSQKKK